MKRFVLAVCSVIAFAQAANATLITNVAPSKADGSFIPGNGIPGAFVTQSGPGGAQVGIAAHNRNSTTAVPTDGNSTFYVPAGNDPTNSNRTAWNLDFQFTPAAGKVQSDYTYEVQADIDPGAGTNFMTFDPIALGDSVFTNPANGSWSDNTTPFVIANSENYKFGFLAGSTFANADPGQYEIHATMRNASDNSLVATTTAFVAVPEPASLGLLGIAGLGLLGRRRRA